MFEERISQRLEELAGKKAVDIVYIHPVDSIDRIPLIAMQNGADFFRSLQGHIKDQPSPFGTYVEGRGKEPIKGRLSDYLSALGESANIVVGKKPLEKRLIVNRGFVKEVNIVSFDLGEGDLDTALLADVADVGLLYRFLQKTGKKHYRFDPHNLYKPSP